MAAVQYGRIMRWVINYRQKGGAIKLEDLQENLTGTPMTISDEGINSFSTVGGHDPKRFGVVFTFISQIFKKNNYHKTKSLFGDIIERGPLLA